MSPFSRILIGFSLFCASHGLRGQSCAPAEGILARPEGTSTLYNRELNGFFAYTNDGSVPPKKYAKETWSGTIPYIHGGGEDVGAQIYDGAWEFKTDKFWSSSTKALYIIPTAFDYDLMSWFLLLDESGIYWDELTRGIYDATYQTFWLGFAPEDVPQDNYRIVSPTLRTRSGWSSTVRDYQWASGEVGGISFVGGDTVSEQLTGLVSLQSAIARSETPNVGKFTGTSLTQYDNDYDIAWYPPESPLRTQPVKFHKQVVEGFKVKINGMCGRKARLVLEFVHGPSNGAGKIYHYLVPGYIDVDPKAGATWPESGTVTFDAFGFPLQKGMITRLVSARVFPGEGECDQLPLAGGIIRMGSVDFTLPLGRVNGTDPAGVLVLKAAAIDTPLFVPSAFQLTTAPSVGVVRDVNNAPRQISAPDLFVDIVTLSDSSYEIRSYLPAQAGIVNPDSGLRPLTGDPIKTYTFVGLASGTDLTFSITEDDNSAKTTVYTWDAAASKMTMAQLGGARRESVMKTVQGGFTTEVREIRDGSNEIVSHVTTVSADYGTGDLVTSRTVGAGNEAETTTTTYYTKATPGLDNYGRVEQITEPSGAWTRYTYDSQGRVATQTSRYLNSTSTNADKNRLSTTTYGTLPDLDDDDSQPEELITRVEKTLNIETARSYEITLTATETYNGQPVRETRSVQATVPGAAWDAQTNLVSVSLTIASGPHVGKPAASLSPDGTLTTYTYDIDSGTGRTTTTVETGPATSLAATLTSGTRSVTVTDVSGRLVDQTTTDIATSTQLEYSVVIDRDASGRPELVEYADGTSEISEYACCGLRFHTDRQGVTTEYDYDDLGRLEFVIRSGLKTLYTYDAAGRRLKTIRVGTDLSEITLEENTYDTAGRLTASKDGLGRTSTYLQEYLVGGGTRSVTTAPGGGVSIQTAAADGQLLKVEGNAAAWRTYAYTINPDGGQSTTEFSPVTSIADTTAWRRSITDFLGRPVTETSPDSTAPSGFATSSLYYDTLGRLTRQTDADGVQTLYDQSTDGQTHVTALDVDQDGVIDYAGTDRITRSTSAYTTRLVDAAEIPVRRTTTEIWESDENEPVLASTTETTLDGLQTWQIHPGEDPDPEAQSDDLITHAQTVYGDDETRTDTTTTPDGTVHTRVSIQGRLESVTIAHPTLGTLSSTTYDYDEHGRLWYVYASTGTTTYAYFDDDQIQSVTTPDPDLPGEGYDPQTTTYHYDEDTGRLDFVTHPDDTVTTTEYHPSGQVSRTYGSRTYPQAYTYDAQQRVKTLTTWQDYATQAGAALTTWNYDPQTGRLLNKRDASGQGASYTYTSAGRLLTRTWARGLVTTYGYSDAGDLETIDYSDATPDVAHTYDRLGRLETTTDAAGLLTRTYETGRLKDENYTAHGPTSYLAGQSLARTFDASYRLESLSVPSVPSVVNSYDSAGRLSTITQDTRVATQTYHATRGYPETLAVTHAATPRLTSTRILDNIGRTTSVSVPSVSSVVYEYNDANQRIRATREDGSYWSYGYDDLGQVTSAEKRHADTTPRPGHAFGYDYDDIGNRTQTTLNNLTSIYAPNLKNQYLSRTTPPAIPVLGTAAPATTVKVNDQIAANRAGDWFYHELALDGSGAPKYLQFPVSATTLQGTPPTSELVRSEVRQTYVPSSPEVMIHDEDGNLTQDGRWDYTWDAENRLIGMQTRTDLGVGPTAGLPNQKLTFTYDAQSRRIGKKLETYVTGWTTTSDTRFLYDGWNLVAEYNAQAANALLRSYTWGLDLSGSSQGAGGVGGLLWASVGSTNYAPAYDGNGNIIAWLDLSTGAKVAENDYDAFGNVIKVAGTNPVPFGFSTKYEDQETGLLYYGFRFLNASTGRWLNRDPIEEEGGLNLYGMVDNYPIGTIDIAGLAATRPVPNRTRPGRGWPYRSDPPEPKVPDTGPRPNPAYDNPYYPEPDPADIVPYDPIYALLPITRGNPSTGSMIQAEQMMGKIRQHRKNLSKDKNASCTICPVVPVGWITYLSPGWNFGNGPQAKGTVGVINALTQYGTHANRHIIPTGWDELSKTANRINRARGHLLGRANGGSGDTYLNLVPIEHRPFNHPVMYAHERVMYEDRVRATVCFWIFPVYTGAKGLKGIPSRIVMIWATSDGEYNEVSLSHSHGR